MIKDVKTFQPDRHEDFRGDIYTTWNNDDYPKLNWRLDKFAHSQKNVLRGLHGDNITWKLVSCLFGKFQLIVANNDPLSSEYCKWESFILSSENREQILIPPKFGNGHLVLSDYAIFHYKQNTYYDFDRQFTIKWNDVNFNFQWDSNNPILSKRDT